MASSVRLRPVRGGADGDYARSLLESCDLPTADIDDGVELFVCVADGERVGGGGLEVYGGSVLLRSIAVEPAVRGKGFGRAIVEGLLERARDRGAERAYLLTTTAAEFFRESGFATTGRKAVPDPIAETAQFQELCPESATCMERNLDSTTGQ